MATVRVIVKVEGGLVQDIFVSRDANVDVDVIDWDLAKEDPDYNRDHAERLAEEVDRGLKGDGKLKPVIW